jgi:hypothetical protein
MTSLWNKGGLFADAALGTDSWGVPNFIRHDEGKESELFNTKEDDETSVLVLEDLGEVVNLRKRIELWAESGPSAEKTSKVSRIGNILGTSLATMHSRETALAIEADPEIARILSQSLTDDVVWYLAMEMIPTHLKNIPKADVYYQRLVKDIRNPDYTYPLCIVHGDFNFGNIMLHLSDEGDDLRPFIIDWEFAASNGRGVNGDISEFLSVLHCRLISARQKPEQSALADLIRQLCTTFCEAYRRRATLECKMEAQDVNSQLYRSALLLSGRDIIIYAQNASTEDPAFDEMIEIGLWYLERAGDDMDDFLSKQNCEELVGEDEGFIRSLFMF